jgi:hypothetical protein
MNVVTGVDSHSDGFHHFTDVNHQPSGKNFAGHVFPLRVKTYIERVVINIKQF